MHRSSIVSVASLLALAACQGGDGAGPAPGAPPSARAPASAAPSGRPAATATATAASAAPAGGVTATVYEITSLTRNVTACDAEGPSAMTELAGETFLWFYESDAHGPKLLVSVTCKSVDDCKKQARDYKEKGTLPMGRVPIFFSEVVSPTQRKGNTTESGMTPMPNAPGKCTDAASLTNTIDIAADGLVMEQKGARGDVPAAGKNGCSTDNASKALAGKPCTTRMVLRAKAKEAL